MAYMAATRTMPVAPAATSFQTIAALLLVLCLLLGGGHAFQPPSSSPSTDGIRIDTRSDDGCRVHQNNGLCALPTMRRECLSFLTASAIVVPASLVAVTAPQPAIAASDVGLDYVGVYTDPKHPKGYRVILGDTKAATLRLQDDPTEKVYELPVRVRTSTSSSDGGGRAVDQLSFDFSFRGGPTDVIGLVSRDREGIPVITFQDGNVWRKRETGPVGVYRDSSDPNKFVVLRQSKGRELAVDLVRTGGETTTIKATAGNPTILFEFAATEGGGTVPGTVNAKRKTISFEDGTVWTKY